MTPAIPTRYLERIARLIEPGGRRILGLVGPPGGGKSTLAEALQRAFADRSVVVPMDGFHLANVELRRLGRAHRKGAPDTFDAAGYTALLERVRRACAGETVYAPAFRREIEEPIAGAIPIAPDVPLVITEGNYLLLDDPPWAGVRALLDEAWYIAGDEALRLERLVRRHVAFGRSESEARAWVASTDEPNARRIEATRARADLEFCWDVPSGRAG
jgi:pantothenate kinase